MPIAFNTPAHAAHAPGVAPPRRNGDDDAAASDAFTLLLLAAATADDVAPGDDVSSVATTGNTTGATDAGMRGEPVAPIDPAIEAARAAALAAGIVPAPVQADARARPAPAVGDATDVGSRAGHARIDATTGAARQGALAGAAAATPATSTPPVDPAAWRAAHAVDAGAQAKGDDASAAVDARTGRAPADAASMPDTKIDVAAHLPALDAPLDAKRAPARGAAADAASAATPLAAAAGRLLEVRPPLPLEIATPAFAPGWQDDAVGRIAHVVMTRNERAELTLHPAELGPVSIRVEMQADQASLTIVAASAETRSALEQSLPQLRDLLASQGITLGQASVHDGQARRDDAPAAFAERPARDSADTTPAPVAASTWTARPARGRVDVFA